jgi:hypothetical protein
MADTSFISEVRRIISMKSTIATSSTRPRKIAITAPRKRIPK